MSVKMLAAPIAAAHAALTRLVELWPGSIIHQASVNTNANGTKVSLAKAPNVPQSGSHAHFPVSKAQVTASIKHASAESTKPASCRLEIAKFSRYSVPLSKATPGSPITRSPILTRKQAAVAQNNEFATSRPKNTGSQLLRCERANQ